MIRTKADLIKYLDEDMKPVKLRRKPRLFGDECYKYMITLRRLEYRMNKPNRNIIDRVLYYFFKLIHHRQSVNWEFRFRRMCLHQGSRCFMSAQLR